jgi:glycosyltransferase involved in cell wall biosynthesis
VRVLWLSPWLRTLSRVHAEALAERGHEVLLVTADQHPEPAVPRPYELVLRPRPKDPRTWAPLVGARRQVAAFAPDVVVGELVRDPRWTLLAPGRPRVTVVHDDRPHDAGEERPRWERALFDRWARSAALTVTFSDYVAAHLPGSTRPPVRVVPLASDLPDADVPAVLPGGAGEGQRRDFLLVGRIAPYKNLDVVLRAWAAHADGPGWRGDELVVIGDGDVDARGVRAVRHEPGGFAYRDVVPRLARSKASLVHYRQASQSGAQVLSMQLGVAPVVSPVGALPDYQPPGAPVVGVDDVSGLRAAFDLLADPATADRLGRAAREAYLARFSAARAAAAWEAVLEEAVRASG